MIERMHGEGLGGFRLLMVISSMSPLFVLWAIRGSTLVPEGLFIVLCASFAGLPSLALWWRIRTAKTVNDRYPITVDSWEDRRQDVLVYLFAMLLPFYTAGLDCWRELIAAFVALAFVIFLFWHLDLHYMNIVFAVLRFRVYAIHPPTDNNPLSGKGTIVLITRRPRLVNKLELHAFRITDTVFIEEYR